MTTILVTGGAGYVGSHVCKALAQAGFRPVVLDSLESGHARAVRWGPLEVGDVRDGPRIAAVLSTHRPAAVMHFAGRISVAESESDPASHYDVNLAGSLAVLEAMRSAGIGSFVFSSSAAVYGEPESVPIRESAPTTPTTPYGRSKRMVERILADYAAHGLRAVSLRYFNAAGADRDAEIGEAHDPETHLIPRALMAAMGEIEAIDLYGNDYGTPDGTPIRDFIHVEDLAAGHIAALRRLLDGGEGGPFNLGTGRGTSVREVLDSVARVTGCWPPVRIAPRRSGDPSRLVTAPDAATEVLGFRPRWTQIDAIAESAWRWHRAQRRSTAPVRAPSRPAFVHSPHARQTVPRPSADRAAPYLRSASDPRSAGT